MFLQPTDDTKKLRRMLYENGVKWEPSMYLKETLVDCETTWEFNGVKWCACESPYGGLILRTVDYTLTPEQVVGAMCATEATEAKKNDNTTGRMSELDACVEVLNRYLDGYKRIYESQREELETAKSIGCDPEYIDDVRVRKHDTAVRRDLLETVLRDIVDSVHDKLQADANERVDD